MLESAIQDQLKLVFQKLESQITLQVKRSDHSSQTELLELLNALAACSSQIDVKTIDQTSDVPEFELLRNGEPTRVSFRGVPGGHEFSSLVLAVLNADGKGKLPDQAFRERIRSLKGPIQISTYISLSCENCPGVVQVLNQFALLHPHFFHQMRDGALVPEEVSALGLQGVPAVVANGKLIHSGKGEALALLEKLEAFFGKEETKREPQNLGKFDVVVVGGGPAGASAAIYSARKGLKTALLAEKLGGQVQETKGIENLISVPYTEGAKLASQLQEHLAAYPVTVLTHRRVAKVEERQGESHLRLEDGDSLAASSLIVATGAKWRELGIPGEKEYLGRGVAFCPHCDGPFYQGKKVAVIGGGNSGIEAALDLAGIAREVVVFEYLDRLKADQVLVDKLKSQNNIKVILNARTKEIVGDGSKVTELQYEDRTTGIVKVESLDGVFVQIGLLPNSAFMKGLVNTTPAGEIIVDEKGRTSRKGIYAAGDVTTTPYKQIIIAMGEGAKVALAAFEDKLRAAS